MRIKIRGGTAYAGDPPLCLTCRSATIVRGPGLADEVVECGRLSPAHRRMTFPVTSCSDYSDRRRASVYEMEEIAWILRSDPKRKEIGFAKPERRLSLTQLSFDEDAD